MQRRQKLRKRLRRLFVWEKFLSGNVDLQKRTKVRKQGLTQQNKCATTMIRTNVHKYNERGNCG